MAPCAGDCAGRATDELNACRVLTPYSSAALKLLTQRSGRDLRGVESIPATQPSNPGPAQRRCAFQHASLRAGRNAFFDSPHFETRSCLPIISALKRPVDSLSRPHWFHRRTSLLSTPPFHGGEPPSCPSAHQAPSRRRLQTHISHQPSSEAVVHHPFL